MCWSETLVVKRCFEIWKAVWPVLGLRHDRDCCLIECKLVYREQLCEY